MKLKLLQVTVKQMLTDEFIQNWYRGEFYGFFKEEFGLENYLLYILAIQHRQSNLVTATHFGKKLHSY
jgi:hypothetical protein